MIVGGGPAGLAAAVYGASEGLRTLVVEREDRAVSRRLLANRKLFGFPNGVSGDELASRALQQARRLGAEILVTRSVARLDPTTGRLSLMATTWSGHGLSFLLLASHGVVSLSMASNGSSARVSTMARHAAKRAPLMVSTSISSVPETQPARRLWTFPTMHDRVTLVIRGDPGIEHVLLPDRAAPREIEHSGGSCVRRYKRSTATVT